MPGVPRLLITEEISHRQQTRIQRSVRPARFPFLKTVGEFDFSFQSSVRLPSLGSYLGPICGLDLAELESVEPPRGYGRD